MIIRDEIEKLAAHSTDLVEQIGLTETLMRLEKRLIEIALELNGNHCQLAADQLRINRTTLVMKRRRHNLPLLRRSPRHGI